MPSALKPSAFLSPIRCSPALLSALDEVARSRGVTVSDLIRTAIAREIGRPELAETTRPGWKTGKKRGKTAGPEKS